MSFDRFRPEAVAAAGLCAALALAACKYGYDNPAERLEAGQISGRAVADPAASGSPHPTGGIAVSLKGSAYDQVTHATGRFTLLPLPAGQHTLLFRRGTQLALVRRVRVELGANGQPDGVELGDVAVPFAGEIAGTVSGPDPGVVVDEVSGITGLVSGGAYRLQATSTGAHALKIGLFSTAESREWVGGPLPLTLGDEAQSSTTRAALVVVHEATGSGRLRLRAVSLHPDIAPGDIVAELTERLHGQVVGVPAPDADGLVELTVPEGLYEVRILAPAAQAELVRRPPPATAVVLAGEVADVGTLYLVPPGLPAAAQRRCQGSEDCDGAGCIDGECRDWQPPAYAPANASICVPTRGCLELFGCQTDLATGGQCLRTNDLYSCVPCEARCTFDGITVLEAAPRGPVAPTGQCGQ